ncbi:MAG TPA: DUF885 family protein, partial [Dehalococcoidia bacterium]|nr:DUF885 family protein [Dehalococcoidia bacterium]
MSQVFDIANAYVEAHADLDPMSATFSGIAGRDDRLTDVSPEGIAARAELDRRTLSQLAAATIESDDDRLARDFMTNRLQTSLAIHDAGDHWSMLSTLASPHVDLFGVLNQMPLETDEHWQAVLSRLEQAPWFLTGFRATLEKGLALGKPASRRLAMECATQAKTWSGQGQPQSFFRSLVAGHKGSLHASLGAAADAAAAAFADLATYLEEVYAPQATPGDGVGPDMYQRYSREWNGCELDLHQTYDWGWQELHRINNEMRTTAERIKPGSSPQEAMELLNTDPARSIDGVEAYQAWLQELHDQV